MMAMADFDGLNGDVVPDQRCFIIEQVQRACIGLAPVAANGSDEIYNWEG